MTEVRVLEVEKLGTFESELIKSIENNWKPQYESFRRGCAITPKNSDNMWFKHDWFCIILVREEDD